MHPPHKAPVGGKGEAGILGHGQMVSPGGVGHVDRGVLANEARHELEGNASAAGAGEDLYHHAQRSGAACGEEIAR